VSRDFFHIRFVVMAAVLAGASGIAQAQEPRLPSPHRHGPASIRHLHDDGTAVSENWSGYAVTGPNGSVTSVTGSWIVPEIAPGSCGRRTTAEYSSFWIGIDGWTSSTVEQIGTDSDCSSGTPTYYAWYEFYPLDSFYACPAAAAHSRRPPPCPLMNLRPGDVMSATVTANGNGTYTATIEDVTAGESFSTVYTPNKETGTPQQSSAEWIAESPCCTNSGGFLPLADFGTIEFGQDFTKPRVSTGTCYATIGGVTAPIGAFGLNGTQVWSSTMVNQNTPNPAPNPLPAADLMAVPSALTKDFSSFTVQWKSVGP
jgi:Peptidase A4 family